MGAILRGGGVNYTGSKNGVPQFSYVIFFNFEDNEHLLSSTKTFNEVWCKS